MADFKFTEHAEHERGFSVIYDRDIAPYLRKKEQDRSYAAKRSNWWISLVGVIAAILAWMAFGLDPLLSIFPIIFGAGAIALILFNRSDKIEKEITNHLRIIICNFFEDLNYFESATDETIKKNLLEKLEPDPKLS